jgi:hypothetical protein
MLQGSDDSGQVLALSLGIALPFAGFFLLVLLCIAGCLGCWTRKRGGGRHD